MSFAHWLIYGLSDPRDGKVRYVGATKVGLQYRMHAHLHDARNGESNHRCNWIRSLLAEGIKPEAKVLEETDEHNWQEAERRWIASLPDLTNNAEGGIGRTGPLSDVTKARIKAAHQGKPGPIAKGSKLSEEHKAKIAKSLIGNQRMKGKKIADTTKHRESQKARWARERAEKGGGA